MGTTLVPAGSSSFKQGGVANRVLCLVLAVALVATMTVLPLPAYATDSGGGTPHAQASASLPNVAARSQADIKAFLKSHPLNMYDDVQFATTPSLVAPFTVGKLSSKTLNESLNAVNLMRFIAGLDSNVTLDAAYTEKAQAGALLNALNGELSHYPGRPAGVSDELYQLGYDGCSQGNLGAGHLNPVVSILSYMEDSDSSNICCVGHRRWILNPSMGKTGFGMVISPSAPYGACSATYAFDMSNSSASQNNVVWPAQNMPLDYFDENQAWSISAGTPVQASNVKVILTRIADGRKWEFSTQAADGEFYVDNGNYGLTGCVIFRPSGLTSLKEGDIFRVQTSGMPTDLDYTVSFFRADPLSAYMRVEPDVRGTTFPCDGQLQVAVWPGTGYEVTGTYYAYDPGTYQCTLTLKKGYVWRDGTSAPKTIKWTIKPASSPATAKPSSSTAKAKKPAATSLKSVKAGKKKATVKWKKQTKNVSGYQVWLSTSKKFTKKTTIKKTVSKKKTSLTVKKLKAKKKYYVKIRTYYKNPTTKKLTYSKWSKVKTVKIKK